jgi:UDP-glucose 4-epimerase
MTVLVTGGAGYIGAVTVEHLRSQGEEVIVLDNLSRGHRKSVPREVSFYEGDIGDRELLLRVMRENQIDSCIHFAALAYVGESVENPQRYFENNVGQGIRFLGALLQGGVRRIIFSSSCAVYGEPESLPIRETARQLPTNPYGWSKLILERVLASYDSAYGLKFVALRYFNAAGATATLGEWHNPETHVIANILRAASGRLREVSVYGNSYPTPDGTAIRDYIHVSDLAEAHWLALDYLTRTHRSVMLNLGGGNGHSILKVIEVARQITGRAIPVRFEVPRPGDPSQLVADSSEAQKLLNWQPHRSELSNIIRTAWHWHLSHPMGYSSDVCTNA